jgi:hypothetical protein
MATGGESSESFDVDKIISHRVVSKTITKFKIKWSGYKRKDCTEEEIETLFSIPLLLMEYVHQSREKFRSRQPSQEADSGATFTTVHRSILNQCKLEDEYIPKGNEHVGKFVAQCDRGTEGLFWLVKFMEMPDNFVFVRKCLMVYYFPMESMRFMKEKLNVSVV